MDIDLNQAVRELLDKQEIRERILTYARACDRVDREMMAPTFHEDAVYNHVEMPGGGVAGRDNIVEGVCGALGEPHILGMTHFLPNMLIELEGDVAFSETYGLTYHLRQVEGGETTYFRALRALDRWERRDGKNWRIAYRVFVHDLIERDDLVTHIRSDRGAYFGRKDKDDQFYKFREASDPKNRPQFA